jgi:WhiB family redox-sensing transcriptional regulator
MAMTNYEMSSGMHYHFPSWMGTPEAKCFGVTEFFYPDRSNAEVMRAKNVCNGNDGLPPCRRRSECLQWAIDNGELYGVWGGTSERDRRKIRRARRLSKNLLVYSFEDVAFPGVLRIKRRRILYVKRRK